MVNAAIPNSNRLGSDELGGSEHMKLVIAIIEMLR